MTERGLRVAVAGTGAFGRNHLRVYSELAADGVTLAAAIEPVEARAAEVKSKYGIPVFATVEDALRAELKLDAASVAVPTGQHHAVTRQMLEAGVDCLVEKPIAATLAEEWSVMEPTSGLRANAARLVERFDLKAADALQLAAALEWCENSPFGDVFLTADQKLREAAVVSGFDGKRL